MAIQEHKFPNQDDAHFQNAIDSDEIDIVHFPAMGENSIFDKTIYYNKFKEHLIRKGLWTWERIHLADKRKSKILDIYSNKNKKMINFSSMSYLGLTFHPKLLERCCRALKKFGLTATSNSMLDGITELHREAEQRLANFLGYEDAITFPSGYATMLGTTQALLNPKTAVVFDEYSHSSLQDGIKLASARRFIFKHNDVTDFKSKLEQAMRFKQKLILTEGIFSITGDIPNILEIEKLARKFECALMIDDAHGIGVLGKTGKGIIEEFDLKYVDIYCGVLSKALGLTGGFTCSSKKVIDYLRLYAGPAIGSSNTSPVFSEGILAVIDILENEPQHLNALKENINYARALLSSIGFPLGKTATPIISLPVGKSSTLRKVSRFFYDNSILVHPLPYPRAPKDRATIRVCVNANNTKREIDFLAKIIRQANENFHLFQDGIFEIDRNLT